MFTDEQIKKATEYNNNHRMFIVYSCIGIVLLYFSTGLYTIYGMNNIAILSLFILSPLVMYYCTYLDDYYFLHLD